MLGLVAVASMIGCAGPRAAPGGGDAGNELGNVVPADPVGRNGTAREASTMIQEDVRLALSVQGEPRAGEPIVLELAVSNDGDAAIDVDFSNGQRYDFEIFAQDGSVVWHWAEGMFFTMMLGRETIPPGGALRWSERVTDGLPAGTYRVVGTLAAMERSSTELTLTVGS